jgi:hypothetical protein
MKKVFLTGYPHSGTSILKSKLSECSNVYEQIEESILPTEIDKAQSENKEIYLWKRPLLDHTEKTSFNILVEKGFTEKNNTDFVDTDIIMIMRNPYYVYNSIAKIFNDKFKDKSESLLIDNFIEIYQRAGRLFLDGKNNNYSGVYTIHYEDLFDNDFIKIKELMNNIGMLYDEDIFEKKSKKYLINKRVSDIPDEKPEHYLGDPGVYRTWQINQPFSNFNNPEKLNLPKSLIKVMDKSTVVKELGYSNPFINL